MLKKIYESTLFGIAGILVTVIGAKEFWDSAIKTRFSK